jgi:RNA binding exosome subunit
VRSIFSALHARTFCHATEDLDRVRTALENAVGACEIRITKTEGHHGNPILVLEATIEEKKGIDEFFSSLGEENIEEILSSLSSRMDESCNLFIRLDKQAAFKGEMRLGSVDVISVRIRVQSYPSRSDISASSVQQYFLGGRS